MGDLIVKKGKVWYANCSYQKVLLRDSLKTEEKKIAVERLQELFMLVREGRYQFYKIKFDDLVKKYNPEIDCKNKLRSIKNHLMPAFKGMRMHEIDIQAWAVKIAEKFAGNTALAILRPAKEMGFTIDYKAIAFKPGKLFDGSQILSLDMGFEALAYIKAGARRKQYHGIAHVAMFSTMPLSDLLHLRKMDVDFNNPDPQLRGITYIRRKTRHKGRPPLFVPMTNRLREAFMGIPTPILDKGLWFFGLTTEGVSQVVARGLIAVGWRHGGGMHVFRHFGACYLIRQGVDLVAIRELMGHADFKTTLIYARIDRETFIGEIQKFDAK